MSLQSSLNIKIGSVMQSLDKRLITGKVNTEPLIILDILIDSLLFAMTRYNLGEERYYDKIKILNGKIHNLKYHCPDVCIYKDRLIIINEGNTAPVIDDNIIDLPALSEYQTLNYSDVIHNYHDEEGDAISQVVIVSKGSDTDLLIDNNSVIIGNQYQPNIDFKIKFNANDGDITYLTQNNDGDPCTANLVSINQNEYNQGIQDGYNFSFGSDGQAVFQRLNNAVEEIPNDTIIYVHIDTSSMASTDQTTLREVVLEWWDSFRAANPDFVGSLLINTIRNDEIPPTLNGPTYAAGRQANGICSSSFFVNDVEAWLLNPIQGIARQMWKEGNPVSVSKEDLLQFAQDKSLIVLTFVDESNPRYHGSSTPGFQSSNIYQPTSSYVSDYTSFLYELRPNLRLFKGVLYPIVKTTTTPTSFVAHSMAAIEARLLTIPEIDTLLGPLVVAAYGSTMMQDWFYNILPTQNPYSTFNGLKESGWSADFTKLSPASDVFNSEDFEEELNMLLTDTSDIQISVLEEYTVPTTNLGVDLEMPFTVRVKDNHILNPLWSNDANILVKFLAECEDVGTCENHKEVVIPHKENYIFSENDFSILPTTDKIKIESLSISSGTLKWHGLTLNTAAFPIIIPREDLSNGSIIFTPNFNFQDEHTFEITYKTSNTNSINYCQGFSTFVGRVSANSNTPPIVSLEDMIVSVDCKENSLTVIPNITYTGSGGYQTFWQVAVRPSGSSNEMVDPTVQNLELQNLIAGNYLIKLFVVTLEDYFTVESSMTIEVSCQ